jgi:hypothetical protein
MSIGMGSWSMHTPMSVMFTTAIATEEPHGDGCLDRSRGSRHAGSGPAKAVLVFKLIGEQS